MTLSGRNGAGKTTLLRMLSGETSVDQGQLVFQKDVRVALHDQRPPRDQDLSLRDYVMAGCADLVALEHRLADLEQRMAEGATDAGTMDAYGRAQSRLEHAGGYNWRERSPATRTCCSSTSRRTIWTSSRSNGSRTGSRRSTPPSCWSPTTAGSWRR